MSEYIRTNKFDTNKCPNIFVIKKLIRMNVQINFCDQYIWIFEYIRHTLVSSLTRATSVKSLKLDSVSNITSSASCGAKNRIQENLISSFCSLLLPDFLGLTLQFLTHQGPRWFPPFQQQQQQQQQRQDSAAKFSVSWLPADNWLLAGGTSLAKVFLNMLLITAVHCWQRVAFYFSSVAAPCRCCNLY